MQLPDRIRCNTFHSVVSNADTQSNSDFNANFFPFFLPSSRRDRKLMRHLFRKDNEEMLITFQQTGQIIRQVYFCLTYVSYTLVQTGQQHASLNNNHLKSLENKCP